MRPFLPRIGNSPRGDLVWGAVMIPATPCKITVRHTEGPTSQKTVSMKWPGIDGSEAGQVTHRGMHYFSRRVTVSMEVMHGLKPGDRVKFMDWNPGNAVVRNLKPTRIAGAKPAHTIQDRANEDGTFDLRMSRMTAWSHMIRANPLGNDANRYEKREDWVAQAVGNKWPVGVANVHQNDIRDVDNKGFNYNFEGPWKFHFDVDHYLGSEWLHGEMEVKAVPDPYTFAVEMEAPIVKKVNNKWRQNSGQKESDKYSRRVVTFVNSDDEIPGYVEPLTAHEFDIFCDLTNGACVDNYSKGDLIYVSGTRNSADEVVQHRSGVKQLGHVTANASEWIGDGDWTDGTVCAGYSESTTWCGREEGPTPCEAAWPASWPGRRRTLGT
jgi:hypothetical protein